ncbi:tetratricopeptide repeat protein [Amycolatopsis sp. NPDC051758]|uniref:tetratricopeptide repeat protein n=1 Tax=Amycolatopsis sp. NPDC051758 TaxID=3363935 RepID=UPI00379D2CE9
MTSAGPDDTREELSRALDLMRRQAGFTVRELAKSTGIPSGTLGGYLTGGHLPRVQDRDRLLAVVRACGVTDPVRLGEWSLWIDGVYGLESPVAPPAKTLGDDNTVVGPLVSLRPPVERLVSEPRMRGRDAVFRIVAGAMRDRSAPRVHVLHGLGGVGKSFLALNIAAWARNRGVTTWWSMPGGPTSTAVTMRALALELGAMPQQFDLGSSVDVAWRLLQSRARPWLLVIDGADDPAIDFAAGEDPISDATGWLRPLTGQYGTIVVTTRDGSPGTWGHMPSWIRLHHLTSLSPEDATGVLCEVAPTSAGSPEEAAEVAVRLGGLPWALRRAGRHLHEASSVPAHLAWPGLARTFAQYRSGLDQGRYEELLGPPAQPQQSRTPVTRTWDLSLDRLDSRGVRNARALFQVLSCFAPAPIPYALLLDPVMLEASPLAPIGSPETGSAAERLWTSLAAMDGVSLVGLSHDPADPGPVGPTVTLHPLLKEVYRPHTGPAFEEYVRLLIALLDGGAHGCYPSDPASWPRWRAIATHSNSPLELLSNQDSLNKHLADGALRPAIAAAQYLRASGRLKEAESAYTLLVARAEEVFGAVHPTTLAARHGLCRTYYAMGHWDRAEQDLRVLVAARSHLLGDEHPDTLASRHYLARVRHDQGAIGEAERLFAAVLDARKRALGPAAPETLSSMSNLAEVWRAAGRLDEAESVLTQVLRRRRELLGDDYPSTLITRQHLLRVRLDRGVMPDDEPGFRVFAADARRVFGPAHLRAVLAACLCAEACAQLGQEDEGCAVLAELLPQAERSLGPGHPVIRDAAALLDRLGAPA